MDCTAFRNKLTFPDTEYPENYLSYFSSKMYVMLMHGLILTVTVPL